MYSKKDYLNILIAVLIAIFSSFVTGIVLLTFGVVSGTGFYFIVWLVIFLLIYKSCNLFVAFIFGKHKTYIEKQKKYYSRITGLVKKKEK